MSLFNCLLPRPVKDVSGVPGIVLVEQSEVVVGVVKDDLHRRILEQGA